MIAEGRLGLRGRVMTVRKFRSVEEMEDSTWREPGDPRLWQAIASV
jgi:lipopolysaccharide/colanic/teichoic acid biosynthesis glycosyltransferase